MTPEADKIDLNYLFDDLSKIKDMQELISLDANECIGLKNKNDVSKNDIYERTRFDASHEGSEPWDGESIDISWYEDDKVICEIENARQFAGLRELINSGISFKGKVIKLINDIDLNYKEWIPIGSIISKREVGSYTDYYYEVEIDPNKTFSGIFDGNSYVIYGLKMSTVDKQNFFNGMFKSASHATFKNIMLSSVDVGSTEMYSYFSTLAGYAESTTFVNISITGKIYGQHSSSICCISRDNYFSRCTNYANIEGFGTRPGSCVLVGGLVTQLSISRDTINKLHNKEPIIFNRCIQGGEITINAADTSAVYTGHLYANAVSYSDITYGFRIDRCIKSGEHTKVFNLDGMTKGVFYGSKGDKTDIINYVSGSDHKTDLLSGIVGKTNIRTTVTVDKVTASSIINNMIIPGSLNTLESPSNSNTFVTKDVNPILYEDNITYLDPYFKYVKTVKS